MKQTYRERLTLASNALGRASDYISEVVEGLKFDRDNLPEGVSYDEKANTFEETELILRDLGQIVDSTIVKLNKLMP